MIKLISAVLDIAFYLIKEITGGMLDFIESMIQPARKTEFTAEFAPVTSILRRNNKGFCLTGRSCLTIPESYRNSLILGGSGSGKSSNVLINSLLLMAKGGSSFVINDPSHEIRLLVSGWLKHLGYIIKILDYNDCRSECYNPLKRCTTISDIQKLSSLLVRNALGEAKDPFWNKSAESLLSLFARYLIFYAEPEFKTLHNLLYLINEFAGKPEKVDRLFVRAKDSRLLAEYKAFVSYGDKTLSSIIATAKAALSLFSDDTIAKITSVDTLDFEEFRNEKVALIVNCHVPDMHYYGTLSSLFFQQFLNGLLTRVPDNSQNSIFFLIDEASSMYLPGLSTTISNIRKYRGGILLIYQDYHQLEHIYGPYEAKNISANCYAKVYLPGQPIETCKMLETTLGRFEYEDDNKSRHTRQLMTADEIRMTERAVILIGNKPPIHAKLHPFYKSSKLRKLTELPPHEPGNVLPFDIPPLIKLGHAT